MVRQRCFVRRNEKEIECLGERMSGDEKWKEKRIQDRESHNWHESSLINGDVLEDDCVRATVLKSGETATEIKWERHTVCTNEIRKMKHFLPFILLLLLLFSLFRLAWRGQVDERKWIMHLKTVLYSYCTTINTKMHTKSGRERDKTRVIISISLAPSFVSCSFHSSTSKSFQKLFFSFLEFLLPFTLLPYAPTSFPSSSGKMTMQFSFP